jgi:nitrogenase molybdenum-iron protein alpha/beta subunit
MERQLQDSSRKGPSLLQSTFRERAFNGIYEVVARQNHFYGINCKLSGSVYVVSEIEGAVPLVHGSCGCAFHHRLSPRKLFSPISDLACTEMDETDVIRGGEEKLRAGIIDVYQRYDPALIVILPTCVSGLIGDDIPGVIESLRSKISCDILHAPSEGFSHRDGDSVEVSLKNAAKSMKCSSAPPTAQDLRGCGHEEMMFALADQLMEEQDVIENSVNLEAFGRHTYRFWNDVEEMRRILGKIGVELNTTVPTTSVDAIKRAPSAPLNIVVTRNTRWADRMKERFGTDYVKKWYFYVGFDKVGKFFIEMASKLGLEGEAEDAIRRERKRALGDLSESRRLFKSYSFAISTQSFLFNPNLLSVYTEDLQMPLRWILIDSQPMKSMKISRDTVEMMTGNLIDIAEKQDMEIEILVDPSSEKMARVAKGVDWLLTDRTGPPSEKEGDLGMMNIATASNLIHQTGFCGIVEFGKHLAWKLQRRTKKDAQKDASNPHRKLIVSRFDYEEDCYPMIKDPMCSSSRRMWSEIWC